MPFLFRALVLFAALAFAGDTFAAGKFFPVSDIKPGMKGYGLSVFQGTQPERFEVEAVGVLTRALPGQDLVLVRCSGHNLEKTGIIAGMSGSPIYFDGRLAGALSYAWSFAREPIAGVTPIQSMLDELQRGATAYAIETPGLRKLASPLLVSGFSPSLMKRLVKRFGPMGFFPTLGAGGGPKEKGPAARPVPGGAVGVQLIRGDWNASAVGTITHVDGDRVLGFGHPLFGLGPVAVPATSAEVHTVFSGLDLSFKFASPLAPMGSLVEDRQSCIVVKQGAEPKMVPVKLHTRNLRTRHEKTFGLEVIDNARLTPSLVLEAAANALDAAEAASDDLTADVKLRATLRDGRSLTLSDRFHNGKSGPFNLETFVPFLSISENAIAPAFIASVEADLELLPERQTAEILDVFPSARQARPGQTIDVHAVVKPYGKPPAILKVPVRIPENQTAGSLELRVEGGAAVEPEIAQPEDLDGLLAYVQARHRSTDLVVSHRESSDTMKHRGITIAGVPGSVRAVLGAAPSPGRGRSKVATQWVLSGDRSTSIEVRPWAVAR